MLRDFIGAFRTRFDVRVFILTRSVTETNAQYRALIVTNLALSHFRSARWNKKNSYFHETSHSGPTQTHLLPKLLRFSYLKRA